MFKRLLLIIVSSLTLPTSAWSQSAISDIPKKVDSKDAHIRDIGMVVSDILQWAVEDSVTHKVDTVYSVEPYILWQSNGDIDEQAAAHRAKGINSASREKSVSEFSRTGCLVDGWLAGYHYYVFIYDYPSVDADGKPITLSSIGACPRLDETSHVQDVVIGTHITITANRECPSNVTKGYEAQDWGLHERYARILADGGFPVATFAREDEIRQELSRLFEGMMKTLYKEQGSQFRIELLETPKMQEFIETHADALNSGFQQVKMSDAMRQRLQRSNYIFSGMKTFHELNEAFPSLIDENGNRKPFEQFLNDVQKIDRTYNQNYLRAEYNFVHASATMAAKWEGFMQDGDRYNLQYRTAHDDRVRPEHAALDRVTLPMSDPFWQEYYPPNGWNCRCTVVQVRKSKYPVTPHDEAMALGEEATGKDTKGIFHFNPGIEQKTFPDYNPYTIKRCQDCDIAKGNLTLAYIPDNEMCVACKLVRQCFEGKTRKSELKRIEENRKLYDKLSKDKRYKDVEFDPETGALKATHLGHNDGEDIGFAFEKKLVDALYKCGHSVILCDEQKKGRDGNRLTSLDMILDGVRMDIKSITKNKDYYGYAINRKNSQLVDFNNRSDVHETADTICIYFDDPTMFSPEKITKGYEYMVVYARKGVCVRHIICAINSAKGLELKTFDFQ